MATYLDSGALVKLYVDEAGSAQVEKLARKASQLLLGDLQLAELRTALRAACGRGSLSPEALAGTLAHLEEDLQAGLYTRIQPDWPGVWQEAESLSRAHAAELLCRTLDILHVAIACREGADQFVTGDKRQAALARRRGLQVLQIRA